MPSSAAPGPRLESQVASGWRARLGAGEWRRWLQAFTKELCTCKFFDLQMALRCMLEDCSRDAQGQTACYQASASGFVKFLTQCETWLLPSSKDLAYARLLLWVFMRDCRVSKTGGPVGWLRGAIASSGVGAVTSRPRPSEAGCGCN